MEKKKNKIWKKILIIVILIVIAFAICVTRKFIIISKLGNESKEFSNKSNYLATIQSLQSGTVSIMKSYNKDGNYLSTLKIYGKEFEYDRGITVYQKNNEQIGIIQNDKEKIAIIDGDVLGGSVGVSNALSILDDNIMSKIQVAIMSRITTDNNCNGKNCYLVELNGWKMWIDKETGLVVREINGGTVTEKFYTFDIVKDEDIERPDISNCKIQENKNETDTSADNKEFNRKPENVTIKILPDKITNVSAEILITDNNVDQYGWGVDFRVQEKINGEWKDLKYISDNLAWNDIAYELNKDKQLTQKLDIEKYYGKLNNGTYRIVKSVYDNKYIDIYSNEFEIK